MINQQKLKELSEQFNVSLDAAALDRFDLYAELLVDWNEKINLTAITDPDGITLKHFADSLSVFGFVDFPEGAKVVDIGTGAGFPGLAMKIVRPDLELTLVDSTKKKLNVVEDIARKLGTPVELVHARAEELQRSGEFAGRFDFSVSRAVANLKKLSGWCLPFVKNGGVFVAMKGAKADEEIADAKKEISRFGGNVEAVHSFDLADAGERNIVVIRKNK